MADIYIPDNDRYTKMPYQRCGRSGLKLPLISLGLWHNFGDNSDFGVQAQMLRTAFDLGITHFDAANNYGPPPWSAEINLGKHLKNDFSAHRDELLISTKAGYFGWEGPYGDWGSRKYLIASLDRSLKNLGLDYVDIFYHHRASDDDPIEETMGALADIVRQGKVLYVGISNYNPVQAVKAEAELNKHHMHCLISQPRYSMLYRNMEKAGLFETLDELGIGSISYSPLERGMLTSKFLNGKYDKPLTEQQQAQLKIAVQLNEIAKARGQSLSQMALAFNLRKVTSVLIGASRPEQIIENAGALKNLAFDDRELVAIENLIE